MNCASFEQKPKRGPKPSSGIGRKRGSGRIIKKGEISLIQRQDLCL
jgi:hypothetical protein